MEDLSLLEDMGVVAGVRAPSLRFPDMSHLQLSLSGTHFYKRYRMYQDTFDLLASELEPHMTPEPVFGRPRIPKVTRILATLRFLANPEMRQTAAGDTLGVSQASVSRILPEVARAICCLKEKYLRWPEAGQETWNIQQSFACVVPSSTLAHEGCRR